MSNSMPSQWIEQREAREALKVARFEQASSSARHNIAVETVAEMLGRLHDQLIAIAAAAMPAPQLVPARVRRAQSNRIVRRDDHREWFDRYR